MKIIQAELRKLVSFREVYIALFFCLILLSLQFYMDRIPDPNYTFWLSMRNLFQGNGAWYIAVMIVVGISRVLPYERETGIDELLKTYKHGISKILLAKLVAIFLYCFSVVTFFYVVAFSVYGKTHSFEENNNMPIGENQTYSWIGLQPVNLDWQYLLYEYTYLIIASFSFGLCVLAISLVVKRSVWVMAICGGGFATFEFSYHFLLKFFSTDVIGVIIADLYRFGYNGMLHMFLLNMGPLLQLSISMLVLYLFIPIVLLIGVIILAYRRKVKW